MDTVDGETRDHPHHRGLWFSHGDVNGDDFWANEASQQDGKKGKIVLKKIDDIKSGKKSGSLMLTFDWIDPTGKTILTENRTTRSTRTRRCESWISTSIFTRSRR